MQSCTRADCHAPADSDRYAHTPPTDVPTGVYQSTLGAAALSALPPTWTAAPLLTDTPQIVVSPTQDLFNLTLTAYIPPTAFPTGAQPTIVLPTSASTEHPPLSSAVFPKDCSQFQLKPPARIFHLPLGQSITLTWQTIPSATRYQLWIETQDNVYDYNDSTTADHLVVPAKIFVTSGVYAWELVAYTGGTPICDHVVGVFVVGV